MSEDSELNPEPLTVEEARGRQTRLFLVLLCFGTTVLLGFGIWNWLKAGRLGDACEKSQDCRSAICLRTGSSLDLGESRTGGRKEVYLRGASYCSTACKTDADCPQPYACAVVHTERETAVEGLAPAADGGTALICVREKLR